MNDIEKINSKDNYPSTSSLTKLGLNALGFTAGGLILLIAGSNTVLGYILGGIACVIGIISLLSKDPVDKKVGILITGVGALVVFSKIEVLFNKGQKFAGFAGTLLVIGAVGLLAIGIWRGIKFFLGLKKRSS